MNSLKSLAKLILAVAIMTQASPARRSRCGLTGRRWIVTGHWLLRHKNSGNWGDVCRATRPFISIWWRAQWTQRSHACRRGGKGAWRTMRFHDNREDRTIRLKGAGPSEVLCAAYTALEMGYRFEVTGPVVPRTLIGRGTRGTPFNLAGNSAPGHPSAYQL